LAEEKRSARNNSTTKCSFYDPVVIGAQIPHWDRRKASRAVLAWALGGADDPAGCDRTAHGGRHCIRSEGRRSVFGYFDPGAAVGGSEKRSHTRPRWRSLWRKCHYRAAESAGMCLGAGRAPETRLRPEEAFLKSLRQFGATTQSSAHAWLTTEAPSAAATDKSPAATAGSQPRSPMARIRTAVTARSQMARHRNGRPAVAPSDWRRGRGETRQLV
jgi:hypothetical protein